MPTYEQTFTFVQPFPLPCPPLPLGATTCPKVAIRWVFENAVTEAGPWFPTTLKVAKEPWAGCLPFVMDEETGAVSGNGMLFPKAGCYRAVITRLPEHTVSRGRAVAIDDTISNYSNVYTLPDPSVAVGLAMGCMLLAILAKVRGCRLLAIPSKLQHKAASIASPWTRGYKG